MTRSRRYLPALAMFASLVLASCGGSGAATSSTDGPGQSPAIASVPSSATDSDAYASLTSAEPFWDQTLHADLFDLATAVATGPERQRTSCDKLAADARSFLASTPERLTSLRGGFKLFIEAGELCADRADEGFPRRAGRLIGEAQQSIDSFRGSPGRWATLEQFWSLVS